MEDAHWLMPVTQCTRFTPPPPPLNLYTLCSLLPLNSTCRTTTSCVWEVGSKHGNWAAFYKVNFAFLKPKWQIHINYANSSKQPHKYLHQHHPGQIAVKLKMMLSILCHYWSKQGTRIGPKCRLLCRLVHVRALLTKQKGGKG